MSISSFISNTKESLKFYYELIKYTLRSSRPSSAINAPGLFKTIDLKDVEVGDMIHYAYDAKWKKILPYWDRYPLLFVADMFYGSAKGWKGASGNKFYVLGLNIHFLPIPLRKKLIKTLQKDKKTGQNLVRHMASSQYAEHLWRVYLVERIQSRIAFVDPKLWNRIINLPVKFEKLSESEVWKRIR